MFTPAPRRLVPRCRWLTLAADETAEAAPPRLGPFGVSMDCRPHNDIIVKAASWRAGLGVAILLSAWQEGSRRGTEIGVLSTNMLRGQGHCTCCLSDVRIDDLVTGTRLLKRPQCLPWWGLTHLYVGDVLKAVQRAARWVCTTLSQALFGWHGSGAQRCGANTATVDLDWTCPHSPLKLLLTASPPHLTSLSPASFTQQAPQNV